MSKDTSPETLDRIWQDWNARINNSTIYETYYTDVQRKSTKAQKFEDWLYDNGACVIQKNRKRIIRFYNEDKALLFLLAYSS
jgi:hypothetical protein